MISIIVPVYNVEKYLQRCIESILAQTFPDFELLLIDDGSKDKSGEICDNYALKDKRIKVFHKQNGGVSSARNYGLHEAQGEWITFIDSDDWVCADYLSSFTTDSDLCVQGYYCGENAIRYDKIFIDHNPGAYYLYKGYVFGPYCKLFRLSIIKEGHILFDETMAFGEDILFLMEYIILCNTMRVVNACGYHYIPYRENSLTARKRQFQEVYDQYVKHIACYEKIMAGSKYCSIVMHDELFGMFYNFIYVYSKSFNDLINDQFVRHCYNNYLCFMDKIAVRYFSSNLHLYKRLRNKVLKVYRKK